MTEAAARARESKRPRRASSVSRRTFSMASRHGTGDRAAAALRDERHTRLDRPAAIMYRVVALSLASAGRGHTSHRAGPT